jgi:hypothetical protein
LQLGFGGSSGHDALTSSATLCRVHLCCTSYLNSPGQKHGCNEAYNKAAQEITSMDWNKFVKDTIADKVKGKSKWKLMRLN